MSHFNSHDGNGEGPVCLLDGPKMLGEYRDRYVRTAPGWRFAERKVSVTFFRGAT